MAPMGRQRTVAPHRLSEAQSRTLRWFRDGRQSDPHESGAVYLNGYPVCTSSLIESLREVGLVKQDELHRWQATEQGQSLLTRQLLQAA